MYDPDEAAGRLRQPELADNGRRHGSALRRATSVCNFAGRVLIGIIDKQDRDRGLLRGRIPRTIRTPMSRPAIASAHHSRALRRNAAPMNPRLTSPEAASATGLSSMSAESSYAARARCGSSPIPGQPAHHLVWVVHCLISVGKSLTRVGNGRRTAGASRGIRPVVWSPGSGFATRMPKMSRPSAAAAVAARASSSAVAAPAETPSTVAVVRIVGGMLGVPAVDNRDDNDKRSAKADRGGHRQRRRAAVACAAALTTAVARHTRCAAWLWHSRPAAAL